MISKRLRRGIRWSIKPASRIPPETALIWWGSLPRGGGATIGDLHAVTNVSRALLKGNCKHELLTEFRLAEETHTPIEYLSDIKRGIKRIVFVCGPLVNSPELSYFLARHKDAQKFAVGVSILPNHVEQTHRFDATLPRDGTPNATFDLALAHYNRKSPTEFVRHAPALAGICLCGKQSEYGPDRPAHSDRAQELIATAVQRAGLRTITIDTRLGPGNSVAQIEEQFRSVDLVLTTRMHGALYGLAHGKPVIAIDQIRGGAKVSELLKRVEWPLVYGVDDLNEALFADGIQRALSPDMRTAAIEARHRTISLSHAALEKAIHMIVGDCNQ